MTLAFKRMHIDIPPDTHDRMKILAIERGMSQKALVASLIEEACKKKSTVKRKATRRKITTKKRGKKRGSKKR